MTQLNNIFRTNMRIEQIDALDKNAVFPNGIEICITRIPIRKRDGYCAKKLKLMVDKIKGKMAPNGVLFFICYAPVECKYRPFEVAKIVTEAGFSHVDNIIVEKSWLPGKRSEINLVNSHEYVLHFCNGKVWKLDRLPIKEYLQTDKDVSCPGNTWQVETGSLDEAYPLDLAELLIRMSDVLPGSIVFDPYGGTSSGLEASLKLGHSYYGFETNERKMKKNQKIIDKYEQKSNKRKLNVI